MFHSRGRRLNRGMSTVAACALALTGSAALAGGAAVYHHGLIRVHVDEKRPGGDRVNILVPGAIVPAVLAFVPDSKLEKVEKKIRVMMPVLRIVVDELERYPDTVFVEVKDKREYVRVAVEGGSLTVTVDSPREDVRVTVPLATVRSVARRIESVGEVQ